MFDIAIIGGGPGGYVAAEKAGKNGLTTILFEKKDLGGVCLNEGCIPTKTMLYSAKLYDQARKSEKYGVHVEYPRKRLRYGSLCWWRFGCIPLVDH